jgi:hypothetical protein
VNPRLFVLTRMLRPLRNAVARTVHYLMLFVITATSQGDMKDTSTSLRVMVVREGRLLTGFLAVGLARREDASTLRAAVLNMPVVDFHTLLLFDIGGGYAPLLILWRQFLSNHKYPI